MRAPLADIDGRHYDVAVIGAGINGAGVAQRLAAEGYSVLLIDKGDYCSGTSSRSSRIMHCGLSHFAQIHPIGHIILHPSRLTSAFKKAREAMLCRRDLVRTTSERVSPMRFHIPLWKTDSYRPWQANLARIGDRDTHSAHGRAIRCSGSVAKRRSSTGAIGSSGQVEENNRVYHSRSG